MAAHPSEQGPDIQKEQERRKILQENLLANEQANLNFEIDTEEFVREWYDAYHTESSSIRAYIERIIANVIDIEKPVPAYILKYAGTGIDSLKEVLTNFDKLEKIEKLNATERHVKEKLAKTLLDAVTKDLTNLNRIFSVLIVTGAIHGTAASIITPVGGFALAALAWGSVGFASAGLYRASRDYGSPTYQLNDKLKRYKVVDKKINSAAKRIKNLRLQQKQYNIHKEEDQHKIANLENKIKHRELQLEGWLQRQEILKQQAIDIIQFNNYNAKWHKEKNISPDLIKDFSAIIRESQASDIKKSYSSFIKPIDHFTQSLMEEISEENKKLMIELKKNKRDLVISRSINTISLAIMAVGMTLMAVGPFTAHAAPIVTGVGIGLIALGGAIQLGQTLSVKLVNLIAKKHHYKKIDQDLMMSMNKHSQLDLKDTMEDKERLKYYLSFQLNKEKLSQYAQQQVKIGKLTAMPTDADLEAEWYKFIGNQPQKVRDQTLNDAYKKTVNDTILRQALGLKSDQTIPTQLSEKAKIKIINRASRHALRMGITESATNLFNAVKEKTQVQYNNGVLKIRHMGLF